MPRNRERVMRGCFPPVRRPALPSSGLEGPESTGTGTGSRPSSASKPPPPAVVDDILYPNEAEPEADAARLSTAIASRRFFLGPPGRSNSIIDSAEHAAAAQRPRGHPTRDQGRALRRAATNAFPASAAAGKQERAPYRLRYDDIHAVQMTSGAPRADFLESMVEMADAMGLDPRRGAADVAALQELLLCYIAVNEHDALSDIIGAYADLLCLFGGNAADGGGESRDADAQRQTPRRLAD